MKSTDSVSLWLDRFQAGDEAAAQPLWERYFERLVALARKKLKGRTLTAADEEDVALSAFNSFFRGAKEGRYPQLADRNNLWRILVVITAHKVLHLVRDQDRQKRGGEQRAAAGADSRGWERIVDQEPTPEFAAQVAEECQRLLARLESKELAGIALWKMEGFTTEEIAAKLNCAPRTVERKLRLIRQIWEAVDVTEEG